MKIIDLRSDTVSRPSQAMREAMATAAVGDDVFGDDPTVQELEKYVAGLFEVEASLYVPSGTMGNQACLKAASQPGWELLCERECHLINYEVAGPVQLSGLLVNLLDSERGMITAEQVRANVRLKSLHSPETKLVAVENTHNRHGGTILPQDEVVRIRDVCDEFNLHYHLDGARIWNAHVATGRPLPELVRPFDSTSVCLSKGLGAPVGSMILGGAEFVARVRRVRKLFGGGMRQAGIIAAGGLYAVKHNIARLADDHKNARRLAEALDSMSVFSVDLSRVQTNIVVADIDGDLGVEAVVDRMRQAGVLAVPFGPKRLRMVPNLDVSADDIEDAISRIERALS